MDELFSDQNVRLKYLPTGVKEMIMVNLLLDPVKALNIIEDCNLGKYGALICNNKQIYDALWLRYISKYPCGSIDKFKECGNLNFDDYKKLVEELLGYYQGSIDKVLADEKLKKYEILYNNAKNIDKIIEIVWNSTLGKKEIIKIIKLINELVYLDQYKEKTTHRHTSNILLLTATAPSANEITKLLLDKGSNVNFSNNIGLTPLMYASMSNNLSVIELLLNNGANIEQESDRGYTALLSAIGMGYNLETVKLLIKYGANVNRVTKSGYNALSYARNNNNEGFIYKYLLNIGATMP